MALCKHMYFLMFRVPLSCRSNPSFSALECDEETACAPLLLVTIRGDQNIAYQEEIRSLQKVRLCTGDSLIKALNADLKGGIAFVIILCQSH